MLTFWQQKIIYHHVFLSDNHRSSCQNLIAHLSHGSDELLNFDKMIDGYQIEKRGGKLFSAAKK